jgi:Cysteine-rich secretory protein family
MEIKSDKKNSIFDTFVIFYLT